MTSPAGNDIAGTPRFLLYSHDALGLGHVRRNLVIAAALVGRSPGASVLLATSADHADSLGVPERVDLMRLPALREVENGHYTPRRFHRLVAAWLQVGHQTFTIPQPPKEGL